MKKAIAIIVVLAMVLAVASSLAITLADSFSSGTGLEMTSYGFPCSTWKKTCWAKTVGYYEYHYVRAYIGGTSSSPSGAWADTGRCYSYGNITASCNASTLVPNDDFARLYFPTGYAKYGTT